MNVENASHPRWSMVETQNAIGLNFEFCESTIPPGRRTGDLIGVHLRFDFRFAETPVPLDMGFIVTFSGGHRIQRPTMPHPVASRRRPPYFPRCAAAKRPAME
ncbi:MAG: hypothetical protein ACREEV_05770 [Dongiaceae bacterium]